MSRKRWCAGFAAATLGFGVAAYGTDGAALSNAASSEPPTTGPESTEATGGTTAEAAAFDAQWADLIAAAQQEGTLSVIMGLGNFEGHDAFFQAFGDRFGLEIKDFEGATDEITARVAAERDQGLFDYDIADLGGSGTSNFLDAEWFEDVTPLMIHPDLLGHKNFLTDDIAWEDPDHKYCPLAAVEAEGNIASFYYNTDLVTQEEYDGLNSWFDLLDPKWNGRIVIGDIASGEARGDRNLAWVVLGQDWFDGLLANDPIVVQYGSGREHADILARGGAAIASFPPGDSALEDAVDQGLPVALMDKTMEEGSPRSPIQRVCVMKDAPHPAAAQLLLNWIFTLEGATTYNETIDTEGWTSIRADAPIGQVDPVVFERAHDESIPFVDEESPAYIAADAEADAYIQQKFAELGITPGG